MQELNFDTGLVTFSVNGGAELTFNPTDPAFVERVYNAFDALDARQEEYKAKVEAAKGNREIFSVAKELDKEMRQQMDLALGEGISQKVFGDLNVYAMANGLPVWCNLLFAVIDQFDSAFDREQKLTNPRIQKYTAKYHK